MKDSEPFFNVFEKTPLFLVGLFILIHISTLLTSIPMDHGVLKPLYQTDMEVKSHIFRLFFHGFLHANWGHLAINSGFIIVFGTAISQRNSLILKHNYNVLSVSVFFWIIFLSGVISGGISQWIWWYFNDSYYYSTGAIGASAGAAALFSSGALFLGGKKKVYEYGLAWTVLNCVIGLIDNFLYLNIAWPAHIGGYWAGAIIIVYIQKKTDI